MSHYHHLTLRDRVFISALTISGKSLSEIACAIGKNVSTISRKLKRNKAVSTQDRASAAYDPCRAGPISEAEKALRKEKHSECLTRC